MTVRRAMMGLIAVMPSCLGAQATHFVYPAPAPGTFTVVTNTYEKVDTTALDLDVFRPVRMLVGRRLPVLIIFNGYGGAAMRLSELPRAWAAAATAHGFAGVTAETRPGHAASDFNAELAYLTHAARALNIDSNRIAVFTFSGNAATALPAVEESGQAWVKAAAFYYGAYGSADVPRFRLDLPVLFVETGLDALNNTRTANRIIGAGLAANAPLMVLNYPSGHHGFDVIDDNDVSRGIIDDTFAFLERALSTPYQAILQSDLAEASATGAFGRGDYADAIARYGELAKQHPTDAHVQMTYGTALLLAQRYHEARIQFDRVKALGTAGAHDLGLLGAEASVKDHDPDAAIEWLRSIPPGARRDDVRLDTMFVTLRDRPDFQTLFASPVP